VRFREDKEPGHNINEKPLSVERGKGAKGEAANSGDLVRLRPAQDRNGSRTVMPVASLARQKYLK
jgi:hypothetical protein